MTALDAPRAGDGMVEAAIPKALDDLERALGDYSYRSFYVPDAKAKLVESCRRMVKLLEEQK